jgi:PTH1 family peptidyl-tRNA hydrolase
VKLIFAQGNPEPDYAKVRHNVGFMVVNAIANENKAKWSEKPKFHALITDINIENERVLLVKPTTFYNETGPALRKIVDFYKIDTENDLLVIHDDLALPFGTIRIRKQGSDAGNNGIKSINSHVDENYCRIKIGIYNELRDQTDDADFVLAKFNTEELEQLQKIIIPQAIKLVIQFCNDSLEHTSYKNLK